MGKTTIKYGCSIVLAILFAIVCVLAQLIFAGETKDVAAEQKPLEKDLYDGNGLITGTELSDQVIYESASIVCFKDRVLQKFRYDPENTKRVAAITEGILQTCPELKHVYVLPVPHRIFLEAGFEGEKETYQTYLTQLTEKLPEKAALVDVLPVLEKHQEEYIFFRTEDSWTARGACYGMEPLCERLGVKAFPLSRYEEYMYTSFTGALPLLEEFKKQVAGTLPADRTYYYLLPDSVDRVEVIRTDEAGKEIRYKKPLITASARNNGAFIGSRFTRAIVEGKACAKKYQGRYVLVLCDERGKLLVPYLKDYYDGVYVVSVKEDPGLSEDLKAIVDAYHITEVVFAQGALEMGAAGFDLAFLRFYENE